MGSRTKRLRFAVLLSVLGGTIGGLALIARRPGVRGDEGAPDPVAKVEATASDQSLTVWLTVRRGSTGETTSSDVSIAAGGKSGEAHQATVDVTFEPPLSGDTEVKVSLVGGGEGFEPSDWWWASVSPGRIRAKLEMNGQTFTYGASYEPLTFSPSGSPLSGTVTSSNMVETTTMKVELPSKGITLTCPIDFVVGHFTLDMGDAFVLNEWRPFTVKREIGNHPIGSHTLAFVVSTVYLADGSSVSFNLGDSQATSTDLSAYVQLYGEGGVTTHQMATTDANGQATGQYKVVDANVVRFDVIAADVSVAEDFP